MIKINNIRLIKMILKIKIKNVYIIYLKEKNNSFSNLTVIRKNWIYVTNINIKFLNIFQTFF